VNFRLKNPISKSTSSGSSANQKLLHKVGEFRALDPFLYDMKRTLTSKSLLFCVVAMILLALVIYPDFSPNAPFSMNSPPSSNTSQVYAFYDSSGYHFLAFSWNQFGQLVSGTKISVTIPLSTGNVSDTGVTNSSGLTQFTLGVPESSTYSLDLTVTAPNSIILVSGTFTPFSNGIPPGQTVTVFQPSRYQTPTTPTTVVDNANTSARDILVTWAGFDASVPAGDLIYYRFLDLNDSCQVSAFVSSCTAGAVRGFPVPTELNQSNSKLLGTMGSSYLQLFPAPPKPSGNLSEESGAVVLFGLTYSNGTSIPDSTSLTQTIPIPQLYPSVGAALSSGQTNQIVVSFFEDVFGLFIPLLAIIATYNVYGKDRISGVLESVLAQPVTRKGLVLSRYVSSYVAMSAAIFVSVIVLDLIAERVSGAFLDSAVIISSTAALLVELAAFIGIMMLFSHVVRTSGALIGLGIGLFLIIDFFAGLIVSIASQLLGFQSGSIGFYKLSVALRFVNPAQFVALVDTFLTNTLTEATGFFGFGAPTFPITPAEYGITIPAIIATAIVWIAVPMTCLLYLAIKRD
jgi:ABC-type transport system involved in multi-copper enzyme maturation permease subunit